MTTPLDPQQPDAFRRVLGHFATGVTILTAMEDGKPIGMTCQSLVSVSLEPPLIAFFVTKTSSTWQRLKRQKICVNVLAEGQEALSRTFATSGIDRFRDIEITSAPSGAPVLGGVLAWVDCEIDRVFEAGDHDGVLARVTALAHVDDGRPLLFFRGGYGNFSY